MLTLVELLHYLTLYQQSFQEVHVETKHGLQLVTIFIIDKAQTESVSLDLRLECLSE